MGKLTEFVKRNMKIYLRDRSAVFFSLMTMIIVIGLMLLFLGDMNVEAVTKMLSALPGRDAQADEANAKLLVLMWTCAGIIPINAVTVAISALSPMIKDRAEGRINSIYTAPVSRLTVSAGYICSTCFSAIVICILTLVISEIYCVTQGAEAFSFAAHMKLLGMIAANSFTYSSLVYLLSSRQDRGRMEQLRYSYRHPCGIYRRHISSHRHSFRRNRLSAQMHSRYLRHINVQADNDR